MRCEVCGAKALTAASTCPMCGHLFELRDGYGKLLPLAYCTVCDSYFPEHLGRCRWCGTKPEPAPRVPAVLKAVGIVAVCGLTLGLWIAWRDGSNDVGPAPVVAKAQADARPMRVDVVAPPMTRAPVDSPAPRMTITSAGNVAQDSARAPDTPAVVSLPATPTNALKTEPRVIASSKPVTKLPAKPAATQSRSTSPSTRWVKAISRSWVVVRADASKGSRIVASVGPNSRVQLGEKRGDWRRIRARNIAGWVEHRAFAQQ